MHAGKIKKTTETRREDGIPSASFFCRDPEEERFCRCLSDLAVKALICEVDATPKPGLVDRDNTGAHRDMDHPMFLRSAYALRDFFFQCAALGQHWNAEEPVSHRILQLRRAGLRGEQAMFAATGGVNTHKGLIFSLGILTAACGMLAVQQGKGVSEALPLKEGDLQQACGQLARALLADEDAAEREGEPTHGQLVRRRTRIGGIKEEAASGFSTAFQQGLPRLREALKRGASMNDGLVETLMYLLAETDDSNLVYRGGLQGLEFVRSRAREIIASAEELSWEERVENIRRLDRECIERNLSPGGCADLLAITAMLHFVTASF